MNSAATKPATPRIGTRVEVLPNKHGHDCFSGVGYVVEVASNGDVAIANSPQADYADYWVSVSRLDW